MKKTNYFLLYAYTKHILMAQFKAICNSPESFWRLLSPADRENSIHFYPLKGLEISIIWNRQVIAIGELEKLDMSIDSITMKI